MRWFQTCSSACRTVAKKISLSRSVEDSSRRADFQSRNIVLILSRKRSWSVMLRPSAAGSTRTSLMGTWGGLEGVEESLWGTSVSWGDAVLESVVGESSNRGGEAGRHAAPDSGDSAARRRERASGEGGSRGL